MKISISLDYVIEEMTKQGLNYKIIDEEEMLVEVIFPDVPVPILFRLTNSEFTSSLGRYIADRKDLSYKLIAETEVRLPATIEHSRIEKSVEFLKTYSKVVTKPHDGAHGDMVSTNITKPDQLVEIIENTLEHYKKIIIQEQVSGQDVRVLYIDNDYKGSVIRHPAAVVGDGKLTIMELIEAENSRDERGVNYSKPLNEINIDSAKQYLGDDINVVLGKGEEAIVIGSANVGLGGKSENITNTIHPKIIELAKVAKNKLRMTHAGVDFMIKDPLREPNDSDNKIYFIEANGGPMLAFHEKPNVGEGASISKDYLQWLRRQAILRYGSKN